MVTWLSRYRWRILLGLLVVVPLGLLAVLHSLTFSLDPTIVDQRLAKVGQRAERSRVPWAGGSLGAAVVGPAGALEVLFIHGSPGAWDAWLTPMTHPSVAGHIRAIAYDRPGFAASAGLSPTGDLTQQAGAAAAVLRRLATGPVVVVGHSYGGSVAVQLALDHPHWVRSLVLVAAAVDPDLETVRWYQAIPQWSWTRWLVPRDLVRANDELLPLADALRRLQPRWPALSVGVWVIHGDRDLQVPIGNLTYIERHVPESRLTVTRRREMNHFVPWRHPELIASAISHALAHSRKSSIVASQQP